MEAQLEADGTRSLEVLFKVNASITNPDESQQSEATEHYYSKCIEDRGKKKCVVACDNITPEKLVMFVTNINTKKELISVAAAIKLSQNGCGGDKVTGKASGVGTSPQTVG
jgi:hypothetical protein